MDRSTATLLLTLALPLLVSARAAAISEETPPTTCGNRLVVGIECSGRYCDNIDPICGSTVRDLYDIRWSRSVSEEGSGRADCNVPNPFERGDWPAGEPAFITGFACRGSYCDNLALECVALRDAFPAFSECTWTGWVSEENSPLRFPAGTGAVRMECRGRYCDDKRFYVCPVRAR